MSNTFNTIRFFPDEAPQVIGESRFSYLLQESSPTRANTFGEIEDTLAAGLLTTGLYDEEEQTE